MISWRDHLIILPIILPLFTAGLMLWLDDRNRKVKAAINLASTSALLIISISLMRIADATVPAGEGSHVEVYLLGDWPASFGIVLVLDRLSALMLVLTSILALCTLLFALARWHKAGAHFHPLFQFLLMGLNGAFLTGDLFNLFVFFEVLLAASYGLALYGSGRVRVRASLHYIAFNVATAMLFLIGASLIYGVTGTLNMAHLAARISQIAAEDRVLLEAGAAILGIVFLVKAGTWPLCFWLPTTYAAASAPVAAFFAILTKVGVYVMLRLWLLLFGAETGLSAQFGGDWLVVAGIMTVIFGSIGALASQDLGRLAGFSVLVSSGTLLAVLGFGDLNITSGALFYLVGSTIALSAFFLLIELVERDRVPGADVLAVTIEAFGYTDLDEQEEDTDIGTPIPATMAVLGLSFVGCALMIAGMPPLSGFLAKFAMLSAIFSASPVSGPSLGTWVLLAVLTFSGLAATIAATRAGIRTFWTPLEPTVPRVGLIEIAPIAVLLLLCVGMTIEAGPVMRYMQSTAAGLHAPADYVNGVITAPRIRRGETIKPPAGEEGS
ncbi:monovalent cation/H+ antiporter subunit D [Rhodoligotrophos ferricapiens]|uniref:monovalent cation/H+ antiporter subunit D n=1 Tax=Rhodoligotrophos ferricapiens TaxID=3069264 RepID=UPI00315D7C48